MGSSTPARRRLCAGSCGRVKACVASCAPRDTQLVTGFEELRERSGAVARSRLGSFATGLAALGVAAILLSQTACTRWVREVQAARAINTGDFAAAQRILEPIAERGDAPAQYLLGGLYAQGHGVPQDWARADAWERRAADQGFAPAQYALGVAYGRGLGLPRAPVQALVWFTLAASRSSAEEGQNHAAAIQARDEMTAHMIPAQLAEARQVIAAWRPSAPNQLGDGAPVTPGSR